MCATARMAFHAPPTSDRRRRRGHRLRVPGAKGAPSAKPAQLCLSECRICFAAGTDATLGYVAAPRGSSLQLTAKLRDTSRMERAQTMKKVERQPLLTRVRPFFDRSRKSIALPQDTLLALGETPFGLLEARHEGLPVQAAGRR